mmetsp:Transcript_38546/g.49801  ORF Transcript_38546/g.49801 Transcript_38546/m.49801 type:complete len:108 (-) Transcript_38546:191-514(-)
MLSFWFKNGEADMVSPAKGSSEKELGGLRVGTAAGAGEISGKFRLFEGCSDAGAEDEGLGATNSCFCSNIDKSGPPPPCGKFPMCMDEPDVEESLLRLNKSVWKSGS